MTIGEKITMLRVAEHISQEELADKLSVSRQSVSKWEMGQALPQIDKVLSLCRIFEVTADDLINDEIELHRASDIPAAPGAIASFAPGSKNKYFGTDGFRGEAGVVLTATHAYKVGRFLGWYFSNPLSGCRISGYRPKIVIGKDTRRSSYMLEYALVAGITASGADAYMLHVTTMPSVSYIARQDEFDCGIMISASHNPFYDNGIKIVNRHGEKIDDSDAALIEAYIDGDLESLGVEGDDLPVCRRDRIGCIVDYVAGRNRYVGYLISVAAHSYKRLRIGLDCANGASWMIAKNVFDALGAETHIIGNQPNGFNINDGCGSTHIETLCQYVKDNHLDLGFAFDGDADRCLAVDEHGNVVTGDHILYILGKRLHERGMLDGDTVVATVMSNSGLFRALSAQNIKCVTSAVGDRFVYETMTNNGYRLGGEQSGHIILKKYATTGDGILTAIMLTEEVLEKKESLGTLAAPVKFFPQMLKNLRVADKKAVMTDPAVIEMVEHINAEIGDSGRVLLRQSGTEPLIRIMVEHEDKEKLSHYVDKLAAQIKKGGHILD